MTSEESLSTLVEIGHGGRGNPGRQTAPDGRAGYAELSVDRYTDEQRFQKEQERVLRRTWIAATRSTNVAKPGDYLSYDELGVPLLLWRHPDGPVRAFYNVCRHRGAALKRGCGQATKLSCPFHGWTYDSKGALIHVTDPSDFPGLDLGARSLREAPCAEWGGWIWVNLDPDAPSLESYLGGVMEALVDEGLGDAVEVHREAVEYRANWKLGVELFTEAYHAKTLHSYTVNPLLEQAAWHVRRYGLHTRVVLPRRRVLGKLRELAASPNGLSPETLRAAYPTPVSLRLSSNISFGIFPNLIVLLLPTSFITMQFFPLSATRCRYVYGVYCTPNPGGETYADKLFYAERIKNWVDVSGEDMSNFEALQRGVESGALSHVTFGYQEHLIPEFHEQVDQYLARP